jgi:hypothetical protein
MGNGLVGAAAKTTLYSLNKLFQDKIKDTRTNYGYLKTVYPELLEFTVQGSDLHGWRKSTLRYAAWLLTSEVDFAASTHLPYPANSFKQWLRWLTWVQSLDAKDATVIIDSTLTNQPPAQAILDTVKMALQDANGVIAFEWLHDKTQFKVETTRKSPNYTITVTCKGENEAPSNKNDDDEDGAI